MLRFPFYFIFLVITASATDSQKIEIRNASKTYDFVLAITPNKAESDAHSLEGPGTITIRDKRNRRPPQTLSVENISVVFAEDGKSPLVNTAPLYSYQGVLQVGDF